MNSGYDTPTIFFWLDNNIIKKYDINNALADGGKLAAVYVKAENSPDGKAFHSVLAIDKNGDSPTFYPYETCCVLFINGGILSVEASGGKEHIVCIERNDSSIQLLPFEPAALKLGDSISIDDGYCWLSVEEVML